MARVIFIGAGSIVFTRNLISDVLAYPELRDSTIVLHDIDDERLETAALIANHARAEAGGSTPIEAYVELAPALDGADYVITSFQVGGHDAILRDFAIPNRFGVRQTIGDTLGIGGIMRGLRTIPALLALAGEMRRRCPDALLINHVNPMAILTQAVAEAFPDVRSIGLCHSVPNTVRKLARLVDIPPNEIDYWAAGVNHQCWILELRHRGDDLYPRLDEAIARDPASERRLRIALYRAFGFFATESSQHSAEYLPWVLHHPGEIERYRIRVDEKIRESEAGIAEYERLRDDLRTGHGFSVEPSVEYAPQIIHSMETGTSRLVYANVSNDGVVDNLPRGAGVEVPCHVDALGPRPVRVGALPPQCAALNRTFLNVAGLVVRAVLDRRREHIVHAALMDPNLGATLTIERIVELVDAMLREHEPYIDDCFVPESAVAAATSQT